MYILSRGWVGGGGGLFSNAVRYICTAPAMDIFIEKKEWSLFLSRFLGRKRQYIIEGVFVNINRCPSSGEKKIKKQEREQGVKM